MKVLITFLLAGSALVGAPISRVTLLDAGAPPVYDGANYVGPYTIELNGRDVPALCIDFADDSSVGDEWDVYVNALDRSLAKAYHPLARVKYEEEAYLYSMSVRPDADRIGIQHAAWAIFYQEYAADRDGAGWMERAEANYGSVDPGRFEILSGVQAQAGARKQEFLIGTAVPEPRLLQLLVGLATIGLALLGRRRG